LARRGVAAVFNRHAYQDWKRGMRLETAATIPRNLTRGIIAWGKIAPAVAALGEGRKTHRRLKACLIGQRENQPWMLQAFSLPTAYPFNPWRCHGPVCINPLGC